jgi:hypothetical protein
MGDGPRKTITRFPPWFTNGKAKSEYHALYNVDKTTTRFALYGLDTAAPHIRVKYLERVTRNFSAW